MAANGARKAPAADSTPSAKQGLVDSAIYGRIFTEKDRKPMKIKLKKPNPQQTQPGNWQDNKIIDPAKKTEITSEAAPISPLVNQLDEKTMAAFPTGRPIEDKIDVIQCKHCRRPVLRNIMPTHAKECLNKKQEKLKKKKEAKEAKDAAARRERGEDDESSIKGARKSALKGADDDTKKGGKKRKLDVDAEKAPNAKKKKKDEPKAKMPKAKGPVDVERQCGVALPNGGQCARSLTCKSHSMGLKRSVPGRSLPYDMLLAQYQKKNQAKQQRAAIDANAPLVDDLEPHGPVDSDEETEAIMAAIARSRPQPLATRPFISTRSKYQYVRMKEMLHNALGGSRGAGLFAAPAANDIGGGVGVLGKYGLGGGGGAGADGAFATPLNSAGLDGVADGHSRRPSAHAGPRQILPGQLPPPMARKASVTAV